MDFNKVSFKNKISIYYKNQEPSKKHINLTLDLLKGKTNNMQLIKKDNGREIYKTNINSKGYYFKKYSYRNFDKKLKNLIRRPAAYRSLKRTYQLLDNGIPVVKPVLAAVFKKNLWTYDSVFVTEDFGGENMQKFIAFGEYDKNFKNKVIKKTAKIWAQMYNKNFVNGDPNLPGILIKVINNDIHICLVDIDNIRRLFYINKNIILKNMANFNAHSYSGLGKLNGKKLNHEDRIFFLKNFIKFYDSKKINFVKVSDYICRETYKLLKEWDKEHFFINRL
ncbi:lipopolysaccharide kinase (Kdo/WaaP) family protein [Halanaerobium sp. DL-01]|uniref:lipopolysaccharide kinase InaA family protein n=1 Tax=Halanaerobium sp. DL-01 TaxID=1653064 RepID=UPI000E141DC0|nr:lipopolysaccharide kinase InaA family protein [Halanaerobium sp. DL-01]RCW83292.1 lipopolysaccharide kinase (Kdo/WaaP) family protein [Halanaerobium sp. DL-01]